MMDNHPVGEAYFGDSRDTQSDGWRQQRAAIVARHEVESILDSLSDDVRVLVGDLTRPASVQSRLEQFEECLRGQSGSLSHAAYMAHAQQQDPRYPIFGEGVRVTEFSRPGRAGLLGGVLGSFLL